MLGHKATGGSPSSGPDAAIASLRGPLIVSVMLVRAGPPFLSSRPRRRRGAPAVPVAAAPPIKPGKVTGLAATVTKPAAAYDVAATWNASTQTTGYQVKP